MKVSKKTSSQGKAELDVVIPFKELEKYFSQGVERACQGIKIKGFREGKIPLEIAKKEIGEMPILEEAASIVMSKTLPEAIKQAQLTFIGQPEVTITKLAPGNDFEYKVSLTLLPETKLGKYKGLAIEKQKTEVSEKDVQKQLEFLKKIRGQGKEGEEKKEEEKKIDDNFAKELGMENLAKLKEDLKSYLIEQKKRAIEEKLENDILEKIVSQSEFGEIPQILADQEKEAMMANLEKNINSQGGKLDDYLKKVNKTKEQVEKEFLPAAQKRVKTALAIREIVKQEGIKITEKEIDEKKKQLLEQYQEYQKAKKHIEKPEYRSHLREILTHQKVMAKLKEWNVE